MQYDLLNVSCLANYDVVGHRFGRMAIGALWGDMVYGIFAVLELCPWRFHGGLGMSAECDHRGGSCRGAEPGSLRPHCSPAIYASLTSDNAWHRTSWSISFYAKEAKRVIFRHRLWG